MKIMLNRFCFPRGVAFTATALLALAVCGRAVDDDDDNDNQSVYVSSGQRITPTAAPRADLQYLNPHLSQDSNFVASGGISSVLSPDGKTLLVLTSGYNLWHDSQGKTTVTNQYIFVYDASGNAKPVEKQVLTLPNTYAGLVFDPNGQTFYVTGGQEDTIHTFGVQQDGTWAETGTPIALGHKTGVLPTDGPIAAGIAISSDGTKLAVANLYNDSVTLVNIAARTIAGELDLRPGKNDPTQSGVPGGEYPFWAVFKGSDTVYLSSLRDREIVVVDVTGATPAIKARIKVDGNPTKMILDKNQTRLLVAEDNADRIAFIDTSSNQIIGSVKTTGPEHVLSHVGKYPGVSPNSLVLSPDESLLFVTNGGANAVAMIELRGEQPRVRALFPTGFYPNAVTLSQDGSYLYVVNGKSPTGPNPTWFPKTSPTRAAHNQYVEDLEKSSLLSFPVPDFNSLEDLTDAVLANNGIIAKPHSRDARLMRELKHRIKHVIYVVRENRTYDQLLGDLDRGNGDPSLAEYGEPITPNAHRIAQNFVDEDNFFVSGDVSANGWAWTTGARESDFETKSVPLNYSGRGTDYETEGTNRNINVGLATVQERIAHDPLNPTDPDILPGTGNVVAPDGPGHDAKQRGYIWSAALAAGHSLRNYGVFADLAIYSSQLPNPIPLERYPATKGLTVVSIADPELKNLTDPYFRGFDMAMPDFYREWEWEREFNQFDQNGGLPDIELVRFPRNHTGSYTTSLDGTNTPEIQQAENDYAVGKLVERVAHSRYKYDTLIFVLEDDAQDGADHMDSHRSTFFVAGPYVKHGAVVSKRYTTVSVVRTIEDLLGIEHVNINTATRRPMTALFDLDQREWTYKAVASPLLANTQLPIPKSEFASYKTIPKPLHDVSYWAEVTKEFDFRKEDHLGDVAKYNRIIWAGVKGDAIPYPTERSRADLRTNRKELLKRARAASSANDVADLR
jgi:DNA-binding beta-propeller fold protein YncE